MPCPRQLWRIAAGLIRASLSAGTWVAYSKVWREWFSLLEEVGGESTGRDMSLYVSYFVCRNFSQGDSVSSVDRKLAGITFLFKLVGYEDFIKSFGV